MDTDQRRIIRLIRVHLCLCGEHLIDPRRGDLAVLHGVHDFAAAADAVAAGEQLRARWSPRSRDRRRPCRRRACRPGSACSKFQQRLLAERLDDHVGRQRRIRSRGSVRAGLAAMSGRRARVRTNSTPAARPSGPATMRTGWANHSKRMPSALASSYS